MITKQQMDETQAINKAKTAAIKKAINGDDSELIKLCQAECIPYTGQFETPVRKAKQQ